MVETIKTRIDSLRKKMQGAGADICLITGGDYHMSEYSGDFFATREFFSGFTGSAGTLVFTVDKAFLFTDGRYFTQAENELEGTGITLMRSGTEGVPTVKEHIKDLTEKSGDATLAFDGRTVSAGIGADLEKIQGLSLISDLDPAEGIWKDRPAFPSSEIFYLEEIYSGESSESKLKRIREVMKERGADIHVTASLDDIAWTLNLRGKDVACNPVFMSYLLIEQNDAVLFVQDRALTPDVKKYLETIGVTVMDYKDFYKVCEERKKAGLVFLADKKRINYRIYRIIKDERNVFKDNPAVLFKAVKNETEIKNLTELHKEDGACVTRLMMWAKSLGDGEATELDAAEYVDSLRKKIRDFFDFSFPTISAFGANAAMMHYSAGPESNTVIRKGGMLLVDSGGQYLRGTTDITRTVAIGEANGEMKKAFTLTLKGMLALADAVFLKGCSGYSLDILAREPLWREGIDYRCGTGHGVGYMLNVHESPNAFRWKYTPGISEIAELEPGMVTTDEPGVYETGKFGIRIENELLCEKAFENEYGTFLRFKTLTLAPIDLDLIDVRYMNEDDVKRLNEYHKKVREELMPLMETPEEKKFLEEYTSEI